MLEELRAVVFRDDLHQPLRAHDALGDGIEARFDRDHRKHQQRIEPDPLRGAVRDLHHLLRSLLRHYEAPRKVVDQRPLSGIERLL